MKYLLLFIGFFVWINVPQAQNPTLRIYPNGYIYDSLTMLQLNNMVKNQGIKDKTCYSKTVFYAPLQARGHYIKIEKNAIQALKDIENKITLNDFLNKYKDLEVSTGAIAVQEDGGYDVVVGVDRHNYYGLSSRIDLSRELEDSFDIHNCKNQWYHYAYSSGQEPKEIQAFYYLENFETKPLSKKYNEIVQRNLCLIDTTTLTYPREEFYCCGAEGLDSGAVFKFMQRYNEFIYNSYRFPTTEEWNKMDSVEKQDILRYNLKESDDNERQAILNLSNKKDVIKSLEEAVVEVAEHGGSTDILEKYASKWLPKDKYLTILRSHANVNFSDYTDLKRHYQISKTAIELNDWVVFIRAYMDMLNLYDDNEDDNFGKKIPIKELESVGINIFNLYISTCLAIENRHKFHRENTPYSIGKGFANIDNTKVIEQNLSKMISDKELDNYNRLRICFLFESCIKHLEDKDRKAKAEKIYQKAIEDMPSFLRQK